MLLQPTICIQHHRERTDNDKRKCIPSRRIPKKRIALRTIITLPARSHFNDTKYPKSNKKCDPWAIHIFSGSVFIDSVSNQARCSMKKEPQRIKRRRLSTLPVVRKILIWSVWKCIPTPFKEWKCGEHRRLYKYPCSCERNQVIILFLPETHLSDCSVCHFRIKKGDDTLVDDEVILF